MRKDRGNDKYYNRREFVKLLHKNGYEYVRQNGGHTIYRKDNKIIVVPTTVSIGVSSRMIRENDLKVHF